jgi:dTDP-4-dehydrorhamnose 3,5-epimerase
MSVHCSIPGIVVIEPELHVDTRGWFLESYSKKKFEELGINTTFVQDNHAFSHKKGLVRGLHYQIAPFEQAKLVRCISGCIYDVAVDIRKDSPTFARWFGTVLSAINKKQLFIPRGFAHGYLTLEDNSEVQYKVDEYYNPEHERIIRYDDPEIGIEWGDEILFLSKKDSDAPLLRDSCDC